MPIGAIAVLACLLIAAIVLAIVTGSGSSSGASLAERKPTGTAQAASTVHGITFTPHAWTNTPNCARHAFGDIQADLRAADCLRLWRASYTAPIDGRMTATTVAVVGFPNERRAREFKQLADTPGTGGIRDLASARSAWPSQRPGFAGAAYRSAIDGATVRLVRSDWVAGRSEPDDPALVNTANAALELPLPG